MTTKYFILVLLVVVIVACGESNTRETGSTSDKAEMYEASELSAMMREMVSWSKEAKQSLAEGDSISVPEKFYSLGEQEATRGEHDEEAFKTMVPLYTAALEGIERGDSQQFYYDASIQACKSCHAVYCSGPLSVIEQL